MKTYLICIQNYNLIVNMTMLNEIKSSILSHLIRCQIVLHWIFSDWNTSLINFFFYEKCKIQSVIYFMIVFNFKSTSRGTKRNLLVSITSLKLTLNIFD